MGNHKRSVLLAITSMFLLLSIADGKTEDASAETTEYELMSLLIEGEYESEFSLILINPETEPWCLRGNLGALRKRWPKLKSETLDALIVNNRGASCRLDKQFRLPVDYRLLTEDEYLKILQNGRVLKAGAASVEDAHVNPASGPGFVPDWDNFDRVFPESQGYLTFSRAGFDAEHTQALVIFSNSYRCNGVRVRPETRKVACFTKMDGTWKLVGISSSISAMY